MPNSIPDPFGPELAAIQRRRAMAQALQQQALSPAQTQTVGGIAMRQSPLSALTPIVQALAAKRGMEKADEAERDVTGKIQARRGADLSLLANALGGRPAAPGGLQEDASGNVTQTDPVKALSASQTLQQALPMIQDPQLQQFGLQAALSMQPKKPEAFTLKPGDVRYDETGNPIAFGDTKDPGSMAVTPTTILGPDGKSQIVDARTGKVIGTPPTEKPTTPYFSPVSTPQGVMAFDARTGGMVPVKVGGTPVTKAADSPDLQGKLAEAKAGGKERGEAQATAQIDLPRVMSNASNSLQLIDQMIGSEDGKVKPHPGFETSVGMGWGRLTKHVPGTDAAGFQALLDQVKGGAFLQAFESLKGAGQITEVEGRKGTDAITRMREAQSEKEFVKAAREFQGVIRGGVQRAQQKASGSTSYSGPERRVPAVGTITDGYRFKGGNPADRDSWEAL
jgi:hypothetical protein